MHNLFIIITTICALPLSAATLVSDQKTDDVPSPAKTSIVTVALEDTLAPDCKAPETLSKTLRTTSLTLNPKSAPNVDVGFTFPSTTPWSLYAAKLIRDRYEESGSTIHVCVGDWGSGLGFFTRHALVAGGTVNALEFDKTIAAAAADYMRKIIPHLPQGIKIKDVLGRYRGSATTPPAAFMARKNHINVAFNLLHHLTPDDVILFLNNLAENTLEGGYVVICCDTPLLEKTDEEFYLANKEKGSKFPGFGAYTQASVQSYNPATKMPTSQKHRITLSAASPSPSDVDRLQMGKVYKGSFHLNSTFDDRPTLTTNTAFEQLLMDIMFGISFPFPYISQSYHQLINKFKFEELALLLKEAGFEITHGWYTNPAIQELYPHSAPLPAGVLAAKLVVVAQKISSKESKK